MDLTGRTRRFSLVPITAMGLLLPTAATLAAEAVMAVDNLNLPGVIIAGANGSIYAPVGFDPIPAAPGVRPASIATDGQDVWVVFASRNGNSGFLDDPGQLWRGAVGQRGFSLYADLPVGGEVALIDGVPYVSQRDRAAETFSINAVSPAGGLNLVYAEGAVDFDARRAITFGYDAPSRQLLILDRVERGIGSFDPSRQTLTGIDVDTWQINHVIDPVDVVNPFTSTIGELIVSGPDRQVHLPPNSFYTEPNAGNTYSYSLPGLEPVEEGLPDYLPRGAVARNDPVSDSFTYDYTADQPTVADVAISDFVAFPELMRAVPATASGTASLANWAFPDDTTASNLMADSFFENLPEGFALAPTTEPAGDFTERELGNYALTVDPGITPRGTYVLPVSISLSADYTHDGITERRSVEQSGPKSGHIASIDPFDGNYIGNGHFELGTAGWDARGTSPRESVVTLGDRPDVYRITQNSGSVSISIDHDLELGLPDGPSKFSFDYQLQIEADRPLD